MEEWKINQTSESNQSVTSGNYYARYSQRCVDWDIEYTPNYWIKGYDIEYTSNDWVEGCDMQTTPDFKVLNRYGSVYDAVGTSSTTNPTKGTDLLSGRHTLSFNGSQYLTCPMDWNGTATLDNLQVFIVARFGDISKPTNRYFTGGLFGNESGGGGSDRLVCIVKNDGQYHLCVGGVHQSERAGPFRHKLLIPTTHFPDEAKPTEEPRRFFVLSVHWNNKGLSGCGEKKSTVYCNGMEITKFTATDTTDGATSFALGGITLLGHSALKGDIGQFLVCGARPHPMNEEDILKTHRYLMEEWKINSSSRGIVKDPASKSWVVELMERATDRNIVWRARFKRDFLVSGMGQVLEGWTTSKHYDRVHLIDKGEVIYSTTPSTLIVYMNCIAENNTLDKVRFELYSLTKARAVATVSVRMPKGELVAFLLFYNITARRGEKIIVRVFPHTAESILDFRVQARSTRVEITEAQQWEGPELIVSKTSYPWSPPTEERTTTIELVNEIEQYQEIQILIRGHGKVETTTLYPTVLKETDSLAKTRLWELTLEDKLGLVFQGKGHKTLKITNLAPKPKPHEKEKDPYKIYSLYGVKLT